MCNVVIKNNKNIDFIIYNLLFAQSNYSFTTQDLLSNVKQYDMNASEQIIQDKINILINKGLVRCGIGTYWTTI